MDTFYFVHNFNKFFAINPTLSYNDHSSIKQIS